MAHLCSERHAFPVENHPQKTQNMLADYHPSEGRGVNQHTFAGCGRLRQAVEAVEAVEAAAGCGRLWDLGSFGVFWDVFAPFLVEWAALPENVGAKKKLG